MFVNTTVAEVDYFANENVGELLGFFDGELDGAAAILNKVVDDTLIDIKFDDITNITNFVFNVSKSFEDQDKDKASNLLKNLELDVDNIKLNLSDMQVAFSNIRGECGADTTCQGVVDSATGAITDIRNSLDGYNLIEDTIAAINNIVVNVTQIEVLVNLTDTAEDVLRNFSTAFVEDYTQVIKDDVHEVTKDIQSQITNLTKELNNIDLNNTEAIQDIGSQIDDFASYTDYILYATLAPAILLGIALLLSCFGLIIGMSYY